MTTTSRKIAVDWFTAHPQSKITFHRRWDELSPASRERLALPRNATVAARCVRFSDGSEMPLKFDGGFMARAIGEELCIFGPLGPVVTYQAVKPAGPMDPDYTRTGIFVYHNCPTCSDGAKPYREPALCSSRHHGERAPDRPFAYKRRRTG